MIDQRPPASFTALVIRVVQLAPLALLVLVTTAFPPTLSAGESVRIDLPVRSQLDVTAYDSLTVVPFALVHHEEDPPELLDTQRQLLRYLRRTLDRGTKLRTRTLDIDLPSADLLSLERDTLFWQAVGERAGTDLILAGAVDFDLHDRSGYVTREFVSDQDGRTYFAQVLVERSGVELDLLVWVIDARSGRLLHSDNFKDFRAFEGESIDPLSGLFSNLANLEDRLLGLFATRTVSAERILQ